METLKLLEDMPEEKPKPLNWKKERVNIFLEEFNNARPNERYPLDYPALMRMMSDMWEKHHGYMDEDTGEILFSIPDIETWREQAKGFFQDTFARETRKFHFSYFVKQYGSFVAIQEKVPLKVKPAVKQTRVMIHCGDCKQNHYSDEVCK